MTLATINPAFEFLRKHKQVTPETEELVMQRVNGKITTSELLQCFQNGISGEYGKVYSADAQTLIGWVRAFTGKKTASNAILVVGLLDPVKKYFELGNSDWMREANKCLTAFLSGVSESNFHPHVYDRMMIDGKIQMNACMKYLVKEYTDADVIAAKQKVLRDRFLDYKSKGWSSVYFEP